ncbi:hypothetical protein SLA2020_353840 [Shorea laevis]
MPTFNSESENEESWSEGTNYDADAEEDRWGADVEDIAGEVATDGGIRECSRRGGTLAVTPISEANFEFERKSNDEGCHKKVNYLSHSQMGEEESVEMVADSIDVDIEEEDGGDRDGRRERDAGNNLYVMSSLDSIQNPSGFGPVMQPDFDPFILGHQHRRQRRKLRDLWPISENCHSPQLGIQKKPAELIEKVNPQMQTAQKGGFNPGSSSTGEEGSGSKEGGTR